MIRAWTEGTGDDTASGDGATWNKYDGVNNWGTAGASNTTSDVEAASIGSANEPAGTNSGSGYATPTWVDISLTASKVQEWTSGAMTNNGMKAQMATELNDMWQYVSSDHATAANRPKLVTVYTTGAAYLVSVAINLGITDTLAKTGIFIRTSTATENITDSVSKIGTFIRTISNNLGITDILSKTIVIIINILNTVGITDIITTAVTIVRIIKNYILGRYTRKINIEGEYEQTVYLKGRVN